MFGYITTSYPIYSSPALYPLSYYIVTPQIPTARERYLRSLAEAQSARARYLSELEEQRILASLQQQEALRQVDFHPRHIFAAQSDIARRRAGLTYAEHFCRPVALLQGRQQAFVRRHRGNRFPAHERQDPSGNLEATISALLDGRDGEYMMQRENEKARAEETRKEDVLNLGVRSVRMLEHAIEAAHAGHSTYTIQPSKPSNNAPTANFSHIYSSPPTEIPRNRLSRERAARTIQQQWRSHSADAIARKDAVATIATLQARFQFLKDTFSFPEHLEFKEHVADQQQEISSLLFTPANAAVHAYNHELSNLVALADAVPSHGSRYVREKRRSFVRLVEEALDGVDRRVAEVWRDRTNASATISSGKDALKTTSNVLPQFASESLTHSSEPDGSLLGIDSTLGDSEPLGSSSTDASTIIPSHVTTDVSPPTLDNIQTLGELSQDATCQDVPSESRPRSCSPSPEGPNSQHNAAPVGSTSEDHHVAVKTQFKTIDTDADEISPGSTLSHSQHSDAFQVSTVGNTKVTSVDVLPTSEGLDLTSDSTVPDLPTAQSFDIVYPDSTLSSPLVVGNDADLQGPTQGPSVSNEGDVSPMLRVGREAQSSLEREREEEAFELL